MKEKYSCLAFSKSKNLLKLIKNFFLIPFPSSHTNNSESKKKVQNGRSQDFRYINGRRYHNERDVSYLFPSDLEEIDRQQQQHYCFKHIFKCNVSAPVKQMLKEGCKVLDVGCGAGIWLLELSTEYKRSEFFGVDMSPVFPIHIKPFNSNFIKANVLNGLPFSSDEFDYVHISFMNGCFKDDQWRNIVIPELVRVLKPNGWLEFYEVDIIQLNGGPLIRLFTDSLQQLLYNAGLNPRSSTLYKQWLSSYACLKDIREISKYPYVGKWKGNIIDEGIDNSDAGGRDPGSYSSINAEDDDMKISEECENINNSHLANDNMKRKEDVELGKLVGETVRMYYAMDSENLSNHMGVTQEEFLDLLEECFEREMSEYDTRMKFLRVICRKDIENS